MPVNSRLEERTKLAVIIGSVRQGRRGAAIAEWFLRQIEARSDVEVDLIDLAELDFTASELPSRGPVAKSFCERVGEADAFVIVTPEYNHSFPASLKMAIDFARNEWFTKPIGFVSYGGMARGTRAVQQLRQVFCELHATTIRDGVMIDLREDGLDERGAPTPSTSFDYEGAAKFMLDELLWWARGLSEARTVRPYVA